MIDNMNMPKIYIVPYPFLPCEIKVFQINDINASKNDFGTMKDIKPEDSSPYTCGYRVFVPNDSCIDYCKKKYNISEDEFHFIQRVLTETLHIGKCNYCD